MEGIVQELLRLESAKNKALIAGNALDYEQSVRAQLHALDCTPGIDVESRLDPERLRALAKLIRQNIMLYWNLMSVSPVFELTRAAYTADGGLETRIERRIQVEA